LALSLAAPVWAEPQTAQPIRVIPKAYVSPGASGSIGTSERSARYELYGGQRVPSDIGSTRYESRSGSQSRETRGGIRQSVEYPGGYEVQHSPGQSSYQRERIR
jgi:hypothetical protein